MSGGGVLVEGIDRDPVPFRDAIGRAQEWPRSCKREPPAPTTCRTVKRDLPWDG